MSTGGSTRIFTDAQVAVYGRTAASLDQREGNLFSAEAWLPSRNVPTFDGCSQDAVDTYSDSFATRVQGYESLREAPLQIPVPRKVEVVDASVIQVWEGKVESVDPETDSMHVFLDGKIGQVTAHRGEIELQWVAEQDRELVKPGAIFYLTLSRKINRGGGIENAQEIRFRRLPSWTKHQVQQIDHVADVLLAKMKALPSNE